MNKYAFWTRMAHLGVVAGIVAACGGEFGPGGTALGNLACPELTGGAMNASFEADAKANATLRAFVTAAGDLQAVAARAEIEVGGACERMAHDLGIPPAELAPRQGQSRVTTTCGAVSGRMDAILRTGVSASVHAQATPPQCRVSAEVEAACKGQCSVSVDPGYVKAHCQPGHLYGRCEATCSGQCGGTCNGECQGDCAGSTAAGGRCAGQCRGTCRGSCTGDCHGSCNVDFKEPKCDVAVQAPSASGECEGSCKAHADFTAQCTPPSVQIQASIETGDMGRLAATLRANLPALLEAEAAYGQRIAGDIQVLVQTGAELPRAFGQLTAHAGACVAAAANGVVTAQASVRVSVQASASVSGRVH